MQQLCCWPRLFSRISGGLKSSYIVSSRVFPDKDTLCWGIIEGLIWPSGVSNFSHGVLCVFASANLLSGLRGGPAEQCSLCYFQNRDSLSSHFSIFWYSNVQLDTLPKKQRGEMTHVCESYYFKAILFIFISFFCSFFFVSFRSFDTHLRVIEL